MRRVMMILIIGMFMISLVSADYKFENTGGTELVHIYSANGNLSATGNISTGAYFVGSGKFLTEIDAGAIDLSDYYLQTVANSTFIFQSEEANLDVNSSSYWNDLSGYVSTWFTNTGGELDLNEGLLNSTIDSRIANSGTDLNVNSSNYWDGLDSPLDILGSQINNDLNWINYTTLSQFTNDLGIGNWTLDKVNYYTSTEVDSLITNGTVNNSNYLGGYAPTFFMPLNKSVYGNFDFNDGWTSGGVSIVGGNVYAQSGYFYDINSLSVSTLEINGSLLPETGFDAQFDLGSNSLRWRDAWFSRNVNVSGTLTVGSIVGDGSAITGIAGSQINNDLNWLNATDVSGAETDPYWAANYTAYNSSWSSTYNSTYQRGYEYATNGTYYLASNPNNYVNSTDVDGTYVPYTGASGNVNLGSNDLSARNSNLSGSLNFNGGGSIYNNGTELIIEY